VFHFVDELIFHREEKDTKHFLVQEILKAERKIHVEGWRNIFFLLALLGVIMASGYLIQPTFTRLYGPEVGQFCSEIFQIILMIGIALMSYDLTAPRMYKAKGRIISTYEKNEFSMGAILEVGILFFGIFGAMLPTMAILQAKGPSMAIAPALAVFLGRWYFEQLPGQCADPTLPPWLPPPPPPLAPSSKMGVSVRDLGQLAHQFPRLLEAVACGSVFMGANTYIGNGPNFMVKTIAEHSKVKMPSFFGYMLWSCSILIPLFLVETYIFFR